MTWPGGPSMTHTHTHNLTSLGASAILFSFFPLLCCLPTSWIYIHTPRIYRSDSRAQGEAGLGRSCKCCEKRGHGSTTCCRGGGGTAQGGTMGTAAHWAARAGQRCSSSSMMEATLRGVSTTSSMSSPTSQSVSQSVNSHTACSPASLFFFFRSRPSNPLSVSALRTSYFGLGAACWPSFCLPAVSSSSSTTFPWF
jgi:hypothetical protein